MSASLPLFKLSGESFPVGCASIEASAGTGKTWTISHLVPRMLIDGEIEKLDEIVLVTFTEAASRELGERVRRDLVALNDLVSSNAEKASDVDEGLQILLERLRAQEAEKQGKTRARLQEAIHDMDRLLAATIHSFCRRVLSDLSFLCGMPPGLEILADDAQIRQEIAGDLWRSGISCDPMMSAVARFDGWKAGELLDAWKQTSAFGGEALHPAPGRFIAAKSEFLKAWQEMRKRPEEIKGALALLKEGGAKLIAEAGKGLDAELQAALGVGLGETPGFRELALFSRTIPAKEKDVFKNLGNVGKDLNARWKALPIVKTTLAMKTLVMKLRWAWLGENLKEATVRHEKAMKSQGALSYDGLIARLHWAVSEANPNRSALLASLRRRWKCALVDECQDTDGRQLEIFQAIFLDGYDEGRLVLIGDPKQSIYAFRGADLKAYLKSAEKVANKQGLTTTHRSADGLVKILNELWALRAEPMGNSSLTVPVAHAKKSDEMLPLPDDRLGRFVAVVVSREGAMEGGWGRVEDRRQSAARVAATAIQNLLGHEMKSPGNPAEQVGPGHCAVLTRTHKEALAVHEALGEFDIPAVIRSSGDVLKSDVADDLASVLWAVLDASSPGRRRLALATELMGLDAGEIRALSETQEEEWKGVFEGWYLRWSAEWGGIVDLLTAMESAEGPFVKGFPARLAELPDAARRLTDWRHLSELLTRKQNEEGLNPEALYHWFSQCRAEEDDPPEERLMRLEEDGSAVAILTMHGAKGLEFDFVFCPFLASTYTPKEQSYKAGRVHEARRLICASLLDPDEAERLEQDAIWEGLEEGLRLTYVALTRAKRRAWILAGYADYGMDKPQHVPKPSPLDWLLRAEKKEETRAAWYARILKQKQKRVGKDGKFDPDWLCEHASSLRELQEIFDKKGAAAKSLLTIIDAGDVKACQSKWKRTSDDAPAGEAHESPPALKGWRLTSFSGLTHSSEDEKDRRDAPGAPIGEEIPSAPAAGNPLIEGFPSSNHVGNLFHGILEKWDFSDQGPSLDETIRGALVKRAIPLELPAGETPEARLKKILASWATVALPGVHPQAKLGNAANHPEWSELPFLMPIAEAGLGGDALRAIFQRHFAGDERGLEYARTLSDLKKETIQGMLHGFIDRLACHENQWAVLDWKSNRLSRGKSEDYSTGSLWNSAAENHYILQLHLYMVAVRRHLARHPAAVLKGAALLYLRGLEGGGDRGVLWFDARPGLLDDLDRLFAPPRDPKETP